MISDESSIYEELKMQNGLYILYIFVLGMVSFVTGEVVTFVMLGIILISLNNINSTLKEILKVNKEKTSNL